MERVKAGDTAYLPRQSNLAAKQGKDYTRTEKYRLLTLRLFSQVCKDISISEGSMAVYQKNIIYGCLKF